MSRLGVVLIVACLIADMATPLCPATFRFNAADSSEGVSFRAVFPLPQHMNAPPLPRHKAGHAAWFRSAPPRGNDLVGRLLVRRALPRAVLASAHLDLGSPRSSEDG
jgi:hypothetical protein